MQHVAKVLSYCYEHGGITVQEAAQKLFINSPTKVISNMRRSDRYVVDDVWVTKERDDGTKVRYKKYFIRESGVA